MLKVSGNKKATHIYSILAGGRKVTPFSYQFVSWVPLSDQSTGKNRGQAYGSEDTDEAISL
jgi:hypothetical protein